MFWCWTVLGGRMLAQAAVPVPTVWKSRMRLPGRSALMCICAPRRPSSGSLRLWPRALAIKPVTPDRLGMESVGRCAVVTAGPPHA